MICRSFGDVKDGMGICATVVCCFGLLKTSSVLEWKVHREHVEMHVGFKYLTCILQVYISCLGVVEVEDTANQDADNTPSMP
jgi:hypothetical protein